MERKSETLPTTLKFLLVAFGFFHLMKYVMWGAVALVCVPVMLLVQADLAGTAYATILPYRGYVTGFIVFTIFGGTYLTIESVKWTFRALKR